MDHLLTIPHRRADGMCPVNGIRDLLHWRSGRDFRPQRFAQHPRPEVAPQNPWGLP